MKKIDSWWWPDGEEHMISWLMEPKNRLIINGRPAYQGKKQKVALDLCPADRRRVMIDAGAHIGLWTFNFAHWFDTIHAFEPVEAHRECFNKNVVVDADIDDDNGDQLGSFVLYPYALGEREDMVHIRVNPTSSGDSWVKGKGDVRMTTIDSFNFENVDFIKVDAEGYEEFILRGATETIKQFHPVICVEQKRDMASKFGLQPQGAISLLKKFGYVVACEISGDYIMKVPA